MALKRYKPKVYKKRDIVYSYVILFGAVIIAMFFTGLIPAGEISPAEYFLLVLGAFVFFVEIREMIKEINTP